VNAVPAANIRDGDDFLIAPSRFAFRHRFRTYALEKSNAEDHCIEEGIAGYLRLCLTT
jgi:hypothetical protein